MTGETGKDWLDKVRGSAALRIRFFSLATIAIRGGAALVCHNSSRDYSGELCSLTD